MLKVPCYQHDSYDSGCSSCVEMNQTKPVKPLPMSGDASKMRDEELAKRLLELKVFMVSPSANEQDEIYDALTALGREAAGPGPSLRNELLQDVAIAATYYDQGKLSRKFFSKLTDKLLQLPGASGEQEARLTINPKWCAIHSVTMESCRLDRREGCRYTAASLCDPEKAAREIAQLKAKLEDAEKDRDSWKREWQMYRDAWFRELGGWIVPKHHEIDALVLTTRKRCVKPILGNCGTPHFLGEPTADRKALQQEAHPQSVNCKDWKMEEVESAAAILRSCGDTAKEKQ